MKKIIIDVAGNERDATRIHTSLSFQPFVAYLQKRAAGEPTVKRKFFTMVLEQFAQAGLEDKELTEQNIHEYEHLLELIYACQSPTLSAADKLIWGLCKPLQPLILYSTDTLYSMMTGLLKAKQENTSGKTAEEHHKEKLRMIYGFILKRLYHFESALKPEQYFVYLNPETGLESYLEISINTDFIEISTDRELPKIEFSQLQAYLNEDAGYEMLENLIPLSMFRFRGISMITVTDVTAKQAVENIRQIRLTRIQGQEEETYSSVIRSLKMLVGNNKIEFDLFPFVRVNDRFVFGYEKGGTGILYQVWGEKSLSPEEFQYQAQSYSNNPKSFFSRDINNGELKKNSFVEKFAQMGVRSLALLPLFHNHNLVGVLGIHTWSDDVFGEEVLAMLEPAMQPVAQLLQIYIDEFSLEVEKIVKEKFTSIQPSVQWKFNEVAWYYLQDKKKNLPSLNTRPVHFEQVYPLYGAVDIRNSTMERNLAIRSDIDHHLHLLSATLTKLRSFHQSSLLDQMHFSCRTWQQVVSQEQLNTTEENNLNYFLGTEVRQYFEHLSQTEEQAGAIINDYMAQIVQRSTREQALETSIRMITGAVNAYLETEQQQLQRSYPCYFEKFRTDGVEYDIYIGQSVAPDKPFNNFHLKNVRLWQLSSMAAIARLTHSLLPDMPLALHTTQLIFIHNQTIDISFRTDERKFDVEGAYNIRYQMIKKRIDKVRIRNTQERLTQPDKIALIYFNKKDVEDYLPYILYLQETDVLETILEDVDLEDLQGLTGLKAIRVGVKL
jgi:hypothetical protein